MKEVATIVIVAFAGLSVRMILPWLVNKFLVDSVKQAHKQDAFCFTLKYPVFLKAVMIVAMLLFWGMAICTPADSLLMVHMIEGFLIVITTLFAYWICVWRIKVENDVLFVIQPFRLPRKYRLIEIQGYKRVKNGWIILHINGKQIGYVPPLIGPDLLYNYFLTKKKILDT